MSLYRLDKILSAQSIVLVGGSPRPTSVGRAVLSNLLTGGFAGSLQLVNPRHKVIEGLTAVRTIGDLQQVPDLAIVAVPPKDVPTTIATLGALGCAAAIVITSGLGHGTGSLLEAATISARATGLRVVGPNCLGVLAPHSRLNASFAARMPATGDLALISQSGAIVAGLVEWAASKRVGFSGIVSLGDQVDVDLADCLDYFAADIHTRAILLYVESISDARKFMSAARMAARTKPVVVIKAGRNVQGARAASTHTGALAGSDDVYDAAFRRAGILRVADLDGLFAAAETLGRLRPFPGQRLAILTNGGGLGVLAIDHLADLGGMAAPISPTATEQLNSQLPPNWSRANPIDIGGDSNAARYGAALDVLLADSENDAVLAMNVPTALASAHDAASAVVSAVEQHETQGRLAKPVFAMWLGESPAVSEVFDRANIPHFTTETAAVGGFMNLVRFRQAQELLMETPPSLPQDFAPDLIAARAAVNNAVSEGRKWLNPLEVRQLLASYDIPAAPALLAHSADEAAQIAAPLLAEGQTVVVKILSADIVHKSEIDGVKLNLTSQHAVRDAAHGILLRARATHPEARIDGVTVHPMIFLPKARELIAGIADDPTFGPVLVFGHGGTAVEVVNDKALSLLPIDLKQAHGLIARTRISRTLKAYRNIPAADEPALALLLVKLGQLAADLPEIREIDLNPILAHENGVIVVDARVAIAPVEPAKGRRGHPRFAVRPYPQEWEKHVTLRDGSRVLLRPVRPQDETLYRDFFPLVTAEDLRLRFFGAVKDFNHAFIARLTQIDYARAMAFIAIDEDTGGMLGVVRLHANSQYDSGEFAVLVRSDLKGRGLGWTLMEYIIDYARAEGIGRVEGQVLAGNRTMLEMCRQLGFSTEADPDDAQVLLVRLNVTSEAPVVH